MTEPAEQERWLPVVGHEGRYEVSNLGRVRSLDAQVPRDSRGGFRLARGRVLRPAPDRHGYLQVPIATAKKLRYVHQLVAEAFIGPRPSGQEVRHGPNGKLDNRATELCYGTRRENCLDTLRDGNNHGAARSTCVRGHLLVEPNLVACMVKTQRACLACSRGRAAVAKARRRGEELNLQVVSDLRYAAIMRDHVVDPAETRS